MRRVLERPSLEVILRFCAEDPVERVFLEDIARRGLGKFYAVEAKGRITALCHTGANLVPSGTGVSAFARIAARSEPRMIVGEEMAVGELWRAIARRLPVPLDDRPGQPVFVIDRPPARAGTGLRPAALDDLEVLVPACAAAYLEEVGVDAHARDPDLFTWRTRSQIESGRSWLWLEDGRIRFKAEASAWTPAAVQLHRCGSIRRCAGADMRRRRSPTSATCCSRGCRVCACSHGPTTPPPFDCTTPSGCSARSPTAR